MSKGTSILGLFVVLVSVTIAGEAAGALLEVDLLAPGDKLVTIDTATGLQWLDLPATLGQSYNSVQGGYGGFTTEMGFRYATPPEIRELYSHAGAIDWNCWSWRNIPGVQSLLALMGQTPSPWESTDMARGYTAAEASGSSDSTTLAGIRYQWNTDWACWIGLGEGSGQYEIGGPVSLDYSSSAYASFLVRLPEPSSMAILAALAIGLMRRRRAAGPV